MLVLPMPAEVLRRCSVLVKTDVAELNSTQLDTVSMAV
jgi:hypothetical protein